MDLPTKAAFGVLGVIVAGAVWWYVSDELRQRRRVRAEAWARQQISPDQPPTQRHAEDDMVPLDLWPIEELDPPSLLRPYIEIQGYTDVFPTAHDHPSEPPDS